MWAHRYASLPVPTKHNMIGYNYLTAIDLTRFVMVRSCRSLNQRISSTGLPDVRHTREAASPASTLSECGIKRDRILPENQKQFETSQQFIVHTVVTLTTFRLTVSKIYIIALHISSTKAHKAHASDFSCHPHAVEIGLRQSHLGWPTSLPSQPSSVLN